MNIQHNFRHMYQFFSFRVDLYIFYFFILTQLLIENMFVFNFMTIIIYYAIFNTIFVMLQLYLSLYYKKL